MTRGTTIDSYCFVLAVRYETTRCQGLWCSADYKYVAATMLRRPEPPEERVESLTLRVTAIIELSPLD